MTKAAIEFRVFDTPEVLARHAAEWLCDRAAASRREFAVCLSGGSTPRRLYEILAEPAVAGHFPWSRVHWFWGDERFVGSDQPDSNFRMARDAMLARVPVIKSHIHRIPTMDLTADMAASSYEAALKRYYRRGTLDPRKPLFDVTLLGLGADGHIASLFPGDRALEERERWAVAVFGVKPEARISLTYPVLESSRDTVFLVAGEAKREILARARRGDETLPAARLCPTGRLHWFVDRAAAPER